MNFTRGNALPTALHSWASCSPLLASGAGGVRGERTTGTEGRKAGAQAPSVQADDLRAGEDRHLPFGQTAKFLDCFRKLCFLRIGRLCAGLFRDSRSRDYTGGLTTNADGHGGTFICVALPKYHLVANDRGHSSEKVFAWTTAS